jgi:hypothetical protein
MASKEMDSDKLLELAAKITVRWETRRRSRYGRSKIETVILPRTSTAPDESEFTYTAAPQLPLAAAPRLLARPL